MNKKVLIVEDEFIEANHLQLMLEKAGYSISGIARSVAKAQEMIREDRPDLVLLDIFLKGKLTGIDLAAELKEENIPFVYLSANSNEDVLAAARATQPDGFLVKPFRQKDVLITLDIARYRHENSEKAGFRRKAFLQAELGKIAHSVVRWEEKIMKTGMAIQSYIPFEYMMIRTQQRNLGFLRIGFNEYQEIGDKELITISHINAEELAILEASTTLETMGTWYDEAAFSELCRKPSVKKLIADTFDMKSHLAQPLRLANGEIIHFFFYSRRPDAFTAEHLVFFNRVHPFFTMAVENMLQTAKTTSPPKAVTQKVVANFDGIIGSSHLLLTVFDHVSQVAPSDTSVLILGESGTGKERVANAIHQLSPRKLKPFVVVNCAALPASLIESELFGHERGAFTGAVDKRIGKFEQAGGGTIFLDEIGEMPVELQVKLLRVLQEKEIERVGGSAPLKINVRIIAATNRNLEKEVAEGRFRLDLYYRLNVFPITLPPLRERKEDLPELITHFLQYFNRKSGKKINGLSDKAWKKLMGYQWPGNIRELENLLERGVLLANGATIEDFALPVPFDKEPDEHRIKTINENERDHIISVLKKCNGKIRGAGGAAELLNVPPSTLNSKMKKLGIKREYVE